MQRANLEYLENLYQIYQTNPDQLEESWQAFFAGVDFNKDIGGGMSSKELDAYHLIQAYRDYGHFEANLDPLSSQNATGDLALSKFNLSESDLDKTFAVGQLVGMPNATLRDIVNHLKKCYCGTITVQVADAVKGVRDWFYGEFESAVAAPAPEKKKQIFEQLARTESLEKFLHTRFVGAKRFSIEGGDSLIPQLEHLVEKGVELGVEEIVIGMAHRGRLNVLVNFMDQAVEETLAQFDGHYDVNENYDGDVKYHLGQSADKKTAKGNCHVSLAFNPSHLEAVNPVVCGMTRAKQRLRVDTADRKKVVPVQIHGDAAFAGQGVVSETLQLAQLKGYTVGGSIHIIIDNQVGFTTDPESSRSSPYASDVAKSQQVPVIHVNGDDPEACVRAMDIAIRFRQKFGRDVLINLTCYRRFGHNEGDEPAYTQPAMYKTIKGHATIKDLYAKKLIQEKVIDDNYAKSFFQEKIDNLQTILDGVRANPPKWEVQAFGGFWKGLRRSQPDDFLKTWDTTTKLETLQKVGQKLTTIPNGFHLHRKLEKLVEHRTAMVKGEMPVDWGMGELLSYGSLILEGHSVRLSGQDCIRGTFTHRHSCFFDTQTGELYNPLAQLRDDKEFCVYNSSLSEMAVLGFEYGNSSSDPTFLNIWEAQFGDFANGAQIIIDQFIASGEHKWKRLSGLVMLLPHGYEGQGPEHSSARLERFLQLCAQNNMQVCNLTTPAQLFHVFRRQMLRPFRVPLVIMSPKSLLRHPKVVSTLDELTNGHFHEVIEDQDVAIEKVKRVVLVSGKLYYDLLAKREELGGEDVALVRVEQLYPFPGYLLKTILQKAKNCQSVVWAQEEPQNMGSWHYICHPIRDLMDECGLGALTLQYIGRGFRASPATGSGKLHAEEQQKIVNEVFSLNKGRK
ncbi:MAG: 2-oxoglutarate dehydrogenase E1 component [Bdellovibrionales bacterium]|nr:2-oxoglutarate dehydrogenase E1 component [Bdellovibrionales bacterium]